MGNLRGECASKEQLFFTWIDFGIKPNLDKDKGRPDKVLSGVGGINEFEFYG